MNMFNVKSPCNNCDKIIIISLTLQFVWNYQNHFLFSSMLYSSRIPLSKQNLLDRLYNMLQALFLCHSLKNSPSILKVIAPNLSPTFSQVQQESQTIISNSLSYGFLNYYECIKAKKEKQTQSTTPYGLYKSRSKILDQTPKKKHILLSNLPECTISIIT